MLLLSRLDPTPEQLEEAEGLLPDAEAWPAFVNELAYHGVAALVWRNIPTVLRRAMPERQRDQLEHLGRATLANYLGTEMAARRAFSAMDRHGVRPVALKGIALAEPLYRDPRLRPFGDIDLYVPPRRFAAAQAALESAGATARPESRLARFHHHKCFTLGGVLVEVHLTLVARERFPLDHEGLEARTQKLSIFGHEVGVLCDEDFLLHLCAHLGTHFFEVMLRWIVDLNELIRARTIDW